MSSYVLNMVFEHFLGSRQQIEQNIFTRNLQEIDDFELNTAQNDE